MLIGAETLSKILDKHDRSTAILFGDGAGAVILERSAEDSFLASDLSADGSRPELLYAQGSGARQPLDHAALDAKVHLIHMQGRETFKLAVQKMVDATDSVLKKANLTKADVTFLVPHQANRRIIDATARYLDLPDEKVVVNIAEYGNTSAASIPMALSETVRAGLVKPQDLHRFRRHSAAVSRGERSHGAGRRRCALPSSFPGQGSQCVGNGLRRRASARRPPRRSSNGPLHCSATTCSALQREGPEEKLRETEFSQPAIFTTNLALYAAVGGAFEPVVTAGHSFAELCSLVVAGSLPFDDALRIVSERGKAMQAAAQRARGGMSAVLGLDASRSTQGHCLASIGGRSLWQTSTRRRKSSSAAISMPCKPRAKRCWMRAPSASCR